MLTNFEWIFHLTNIFDGKEKSNIMPGIGFQINVIPETAEDIKAVEPYLNVFQKGISGLTFRAYAIFEANNEKAIRQIANYLFMELDRIGMYVMPIEHFYDAIKTAQEGAAKKAENVTSAD